MAATREQKAAKKRKESKNVMTRNKSSPVVQYFQAKGVKVDQERYALSELLQWIFRSAIREQENVSLYLPSKRMRQLLHEWSGVLPDGVD